MSMSLEFEPHSWYMGFAIKKSPLKKLALYPQAFEYTAYTDEGNTYQIIELKEYTLTDLKAEIRGYHLHKHTGYGERIAKRRLDYLRGELRTERISYGGLAELQGLTPYIEANDVELLEAAGVPEFN